MLLLVLGTISNIYFLLWNWRFEDDPISDFLLLGLNEFWIIWLTMTLVYISLLIILLAVLPSWLLDMFALDFGDLTGSYFAGGFFDCLSFGWISNIYWVFWNYKLSNFIDLDVKFFGDNIEVRYLFFGDDIDPVIFDTALGYPIEFWEGVTWFGFTIFMSNTYFVSA